MKTKVLSFLMLAVATIFMTACSKDSEGLTSITYYPVIELQGDDFMIVAKNSQFVDPGFTVTLNGEDITDKAEVKSNVNTAVSGVYSVKYSAKNADGFSASATRTVVVLDKDDAIEGFYATSPSCYRDRAGAITAYGASFDVLVIKISDGVYSIEDFLGGYYSQRAGYGSAYNATGSVAIDADGNVELISSYVAGWGDALDDLVGGNYDVATSTFSWDAQYAGMDFYVTMTKIQEED